MCRDEGDEVNSSVNGLEEGGETKAIQFVNDAKYGESTRDNNIIQEDCKIIGMYGILKLGKDRKIQPRNCKVAEQQNTRKIQGLTVKKPAKNMIPERHGEGCRK